MLGVGDGEEHTLDAHPGGDASGLAGEGNARLAELVGQDFHVGPGDLPSPAGADHLENGLLSRPSPGDERDGVSIAFCPLSLRWGEDAVQESLAVAAVYPGDSAAFDQIDSVAYYRHV